jgi:hypothetical protein
MSASRLCAVRSWRACRGLHAQLNGVAHFRDGIPEATRWRRQCGLRRPHDCDRAKFNTEGEEIYDDRYKICSLSMGVGHQASTLVA